MAITHFSAVDAVTFYKDGTEITASAAELNVNDGVSAGTATASKVLVLGANKNVDQIAVTGTLTFGANKWYPGTAAPGSPSVGAVGDIVFNSAPSAGGNMGWTCTTAGTPGTWKAWGSIAS